jgi:pimeloyl-ACP methyl ester carboxylesterase
MYRMPFALERERSIRIVAGDDILYGDLTLPDHPHGLILFAHGNGGSRHNPRNRSIAQYLNKSGFGTLLFDLLTPSEESSDDLTGEFRFDIDLLTRRLTGATDWVSAHRKTMHLPKAYFGSSTGAAAALAASVIRGDIRAVVSKGGRPDLAGSLLSQVQAPTLLVAGGFDAMTVEINRKSLCNIPAMRELAIVPGAGSLFEEPGALREVVRLSVDWFLRFLY